MEENLDRLAAQAAQRIIADTIDTMNFKAKEVDNLATEALDVLQEQGVYAATLFLYSRTSTDAKIAPFIRRQLLALAAQKVVHQRTPQDQPQDTLRFVTEHIANDLDTLLLVKQIWEQTLIYVRYGAKARL